MSQFLGGGGVECGPTSALKDVGSRVERDYGLQRDRYGAQPQAGPSAGPSAFRTHPGAAPGPQAAPQTAFDLSQLRSHLPPGAGPMYAGPAGAGPATMGPGPAMQAPSRWADSYDGKGKARASPSGAWGSEFEQRGSPQAHAPAHTAARTASPAMAPWQRAGPAFAPPPHFAPMSAAGPMYAHAPPVWAPPPQAPMLAHPAPVKAVPAPPPEALAQQQAQAQPQTQQADQTHVDPNARPQDELARTAQALVEQLDREELASNQKLADSQFVRLLRGLGDGSVVVQEGSGATKEGTDVAEGAHFVDAQGGGDWASAFLGSDAAPQGMRDAASVRDTASDIQASLRMADGTAHMRRKSVHFDEDTASGVPRNLDEAMRSATAIPGVGAAWEEDQDLDEDFDTDMLLHFNGMPRVAQQTGPSVAEHESWQHMNDQMNEIAPEWYETDTTPQPYFFHQANPYALGAPIERELSPTTMGVLELEAAVQQDPRDASAWLALGLKQQENEREDAAIRALARAVQLAPETRGAWLALAVSYTNEGKDGQAHDALEHWIDLTQPGGSAGVPAHGSETMDEDGVARQARIISRLIDIARMSPDDLDVDVQVALGVLFNASEDYQKAEDCFVAALEARPDDWVLYNRLGATLANSGRSHEAIKYYHRALGLHPNFVRAQFNLGISYINLAQYRLAAQCILDAIRLQHSDVTEGYGADSAGEYTKGVTSDALWTTLRMACHHLQRPDLVALASAKDLTGFPLEL